MKVLVCGSRDYDDPLKILSTLSPRFLAGETTIIHGDANGADRIAGHIAKSIGMTVVAVPAEWEKYGKSAGPIRNRKMLDMNPDLVLAFHPDIEASKGTKDCVREAERRGIKVEIIK